MPKFSEASKSKLASCHHDLQRLFNEVIKHYDCTIIQGARSDVEQKKLFAEKKTKADGVNDKSKHQVDKEFPFSRAVDVSPFPIKWEEKDRFILFAGRVEGIAQAMGIKIRWGGNWNGDNELRDNNFDDLVHFELINA